jgi:hypothetical protein
MNIEIIKQVEELTFEKWRFYLKDNNIYLDAYFLMSKESKKHRNFKIIKSYERLRERYATMKEDEVPFSDELKSEVLAKYVDTIKVIKWSERNS